MKAKRTSPVWLSWARLWVLSLLVVTSCAAQGLTRGVQDYENGRFPEALAEFEELRAAPPCLSRADWTRYALYRGLTELSLGNAEPAYGWLLRARLALDREPALLDRVDRARLAQAWQSLGFLPAQR